MSKNRTIDIQKILKGIIAILVILCAVVAAIRLPGMVTAHQAKEAESSKNTADVAAQNGLTYEYEKADPEETRATEPELTQFGEYYCKVSIPTEWAEKVYLLQEDIGMFSVRYSNLDWPDNLLFVIQVEPMTATDFADEIFEPTLYQSDWFGSIFSLCVGFSDDGIIYAGYPAYPAREEDSSTAEYNEMLKLVPGIIQTAFLVQENIDEFWEYYYLDEGPGEMTYYYSDEPYIISGEFYLQSAYDGQYLSCGATKNNQRTGKTGFYLDLVPDLNSATAFSPINVNGYSALIKMLDAGPEDFYIDAWTSTRENAGADLWTEGRSEDQRWIIELQDDDTYIIYLQSNPNLCLLNEHSTDEDIISVGRRTNDSRQGWYVIIP